MEQYLSLGGEVSINTWVRESGMLGIESIGLLEQWSIVSCWGRVGRVFKRFPPQYNSLRLLGKLGKDFSWFLLQRKTVRVSGSSGRDLSLFFPQLSSSKLGGSFGKEVIALFSQLIYNRAGSKYGKDFNLRSETFREVHEPVWFLTYIVVMIKNTIYHGSCVTFLKRRIRKSDTPHVSSM
jgi:hypothetical protein